MDLVVDANILIAALIKESVTSDLIMEDEIHLFSPEFLFEEFKKYELEIMQKTHRTTEDFNHFFDILKQRIALVPREELNPFLAEAEKISPDPKDAIYFATAFKIGGQIWSNDKRLKHQNTIEVLSTPEILSRMKK